MDTNPSSPSQQPASTPPGTTTPGSSGPPGFGDSQSGSGSPYTQLPSPSTYSPQTTGNVPATRPNTQTGLEPNVAGGLSYVLGWVTGLVFLLIERDRFVRFHALQSIFTFGGLTVLWVVRSVLDAILGGIPVIGFLWGIASFFLWIFLALGGLALWILLMVLAFQGRRFHLPVVGSYAERYVDSTFGQS
ncbi:MAG: hypothetical protein M3281_07575 [Chloroflexota bacterium]|nr:hypothetical protein [Chloroflexota bacterium]